MSDCNMVLPRKSVAIKYAAVAQADCALPGSSVGKMFDQAHVNVWLHACRRWRGQFLCSATP